jgi:hypothetical protein
VTEPRLDAFFAAPADAHQQKKVAACSCTTQALKGLGVGLGAEARILQIYKTDEILLSLRSFHKIYSPPGGHVQELGFPINESRNEVAQHSMQSLADERYDLAGDQRHYEKGSPWLASAGPTCEKLLI